MNDTGLPPGPSQVRMNGFFLIRAAVEPAERGEPSTRSWVVDLDLLGDGPNDPHAQFFLFGKLTACEDARQLRIVVGSALELPPGHDPRNQNPDDLRSACMLLFGETLWDATAHFARPLAAMACIRELDIPMKCPTTPSEWTS